MLMPMASPLPLSLPSLLLFCFLSFAAASSSSTTAVRLPLRQITPSPAPGADRPAAPDPSQRLAALAFTSLIRARRLKDPKKAGGHVSPVPPVPFTRTPLFSHSYGGYSVSLGFGTPPQWIPLVFDTGSDLLWVPCTRTYQCSNCTFPAAAIPVFSPKSSSSAKLVGCRNPKCAWMHSLQFLTRCRDCPLNASASAGCSPVCPPYMVVYGLGSTGGLLLSETLAVSTTGGGSSVPDFVVGCSLFSTRQPPAGVAGFGRGPASLPSQLGLRRFSYCLLSRTYDDKAGDVGTAVLGGARQSSKDGLSFTPFLRNPSAGSTFSIYYYLGLRKITVNGRKVKIPHAPLLPLPSGDGGTIIDSGTTYTYMDAAVFEPVARAMEAAVAGLYNRSTAAEQLTGLRPCFSVVGGPGDQVIRLPEFSLHFKGGAEMRLPLANYFAFAGETGALCLTVVTDDGVASSGGPSIILGSFQQQNYYMVYDLEREVLGFRQQPCHDYEDSGR